MDFTVRVNNGGIDNTQDIFDGILHLIFSKSGSHSMTLVGSEVSHKVYRVSVTQMRPTSYSRLKRMITRLGSNAEILPDAEEQMLAKSTSGTPVMTAVHTAVERFGAVRMVPDEDMGIIVYAQTGDRLDSNDLYPVWSDGFDQDEVDAVLALAQQQGVNLSYETNYWDEHTNTKFSAFIYR